MATSDELLRALGQTPANQQIGKPTDRDKLQSAINAPTASSDFSERLARIQAELESSNLSTIDWTPPEGGWKRVGARESTLRTGARNREREQEVRCDHARRRTLSMLTSARPS